jgi:hypothetical protein
MIGGLVAWLLGCMGAWILGCLDARSLEASMEESFLGLLLA